MPDSIRISYSLAIMITNSILLVSSTKFKSHYVTEDLWIPNVLTSKSNTKSRIECASLCTLENITCGGFMYSSDGGNCTLASHVVSCQPPTPDVSTGLKYHTRVSNGPAEELARSAQVFIYLLASTSDKAEWTALASGSFDNRLPSLVIDGDSSGVMFVTAAGAKHSWLQIDMGETRWVKGGRMVSYNDGLRQMYTEIPLSFDCKDPIKGRIMTLQKYDNYPGDNSYLHLHEVDIEVYCGPTKEADGACDSDQSIDMCANRDLIRPDTELANTTAQKSDWSIQYSTLYPGYNYPTKVIDGVQVADANNDLYSSDTGDLRPWLQVDISQSRIIKAVHTYAKSQGGRGWYAEYIEVRVGDTDVSVTASVGERICANTLCKTTVGGLHVWAEKSDCAGGVPIKGRYVTLQRFKHVPGREYLTLAEVDIEFYI